jgi:hypothetical protein
MRGQKGVEDARKRAYDPRIHLLRKKVFMNIDGLPGHSASSDALRPAMTNRVGAQWPIYLN